METRIRPIPSLQFMGRRFMDFQILFSWISKFYFLFTASILDTTNEGPTNLGKGVTADRSTMVHLTTVPRNKHLTKQGACKKLKGDVASEPRPQHIPSFAGFVKQVVLLVHKSNLPTAALRSDGIAVSPGEKRFGKPCHSGHLV